LDGVKERKPYNSRLFGAILFVFALLGIALIVYRIASYRYEFDENFYPVDYGRFNFLSYFTVLSNILGYFYLFLCAFACFGNERAKRKAFSPLLKLMTVEYTVISGIVYLSGLSMGFSSPLTFDTAAHFMMSVMQIFYHIVMPLIMIIMLFLPATDEKIRLKKAWLFGIFPLVYSVFSIIRGAVSRLHFYPYPFYKPDFFWEMLFKDKPLESTKAFLLLIPFLIAGILLFILIAIIFILIHNRLTGGKENGTD